jgi:gluconolactonase
MRVIGSAIHVLLATVSLAAAGAPALPAGSPIYVFDLAKSADVASLRGTWRYSDTRIVPTKFYAANEQGQPGNAEVGSYDFEPHAGAADFDDSQWQVLTPESLSERRGNGRLSFNWYRITFTVPEKSGDVDLRGTTAVFKTSLDDYAEVWVNGELARSAGQNGGSVIAGWNAENQLVVGRNIKPGQKIALAVFGINGPISNPPTNYIWLRYAKLEFYKDAPATPLAITPAEVNVTIERADPAFDELVGKNPKIFKLAEGFTFTEGPVWVRDGGYLLFSDPNENRIYKYTADGQLSVLRERSGYDAPDIAEYGQPGSNGLTIDPQGRLTINQHGNHRVVRVEKDGHDTVLADSFEGKRLNSPNDLVYRSDGALFFTDPPFGLPKFHADPRRQLPFEGVFSFYKGKFRVVSKDMTGPNGIAFSPDEKYLYVGNWDEKKKVVYRYEVMPDATLKNGTVFFDMTSAPGEDAIDGIKVDQRGNLYVSGPGGLWVISKEGKHLGTIVPPLHPHNLAWGGNDNSTLYLTAKSGLYRMHVNVPGAGVH